MIFHFGDVVRHYSQVVPLTVIKQEKTEVEVFWFDVSYGLQTWKFPTGELRMVLATHYDGDLT